MLVEVLVVGTAALVAATIAGVTGFGGAVLLLPALVWAVGARDAVVVLTVAQLVGNGSRVAFNRHDVDAAVLKRFAIGAVPFALAGGLLFAATPSGVLTRVLGAFLLAAVHPGALLPSRAAGGLRRAQRPLRPDLTKEGQDARGRRHYVGPPTWTRTSCRPPRASRRAGSRSHGRCRCGASTR